MYDLVVLKDRSGYLTSVFDKRGNEIWNNLNYSDLIATDLIKQHFVFNTVLFDDWSSFCVGTLSTLGLFNKNTKLINISDIKQDDEFIANEYMGTYGKARYIHRMYLKDCNQIAC